ncbi:hypothetical protein FPV67DRAFT_1460741 [Lyophyllum atratum]|nr:hypothetical protein FPV67DRAFT_1460741 [Lyophyllum atratum]
MVNVTPQAASGLCFEDGNVILRADTTTVRVHRGVLGFHSSVFRQMWEDAPSPARQLPTVLLRDTAEDLVRYVNAVYHHNSGVDAAGAISIAEVGSLLRMGRKYAHVGMVACMTERVAAEYPAALAAWDYARRNRFTRIEDCVGFGFEVLDVVYGNDLHASVPGLLYEICSTYSSEDLRTAVEQYDGKTVTVSARDQILCNVGRDRLAVAQSVHTFAWVECLPGTNCSSPESCEALVAALRLSLWGATRKISALDVWDEDWGIELCASCGEEAELIHRRGRHAVWANLPSYFDLGEWEDLSRLQEKLSNLVVDVEVEFV